LRSDINPNYVSESCEFDRPKMIDNVQKANHVYENMHVAELVTVVAIDLILF